MRTVYFQGLLPSPSTAAGDAPAEHSRGHSAPRTMGTAAAFGSAAAIAMFLMASSAVVPPSSFLPSDGGVGGGGGGGRNSFGFRFATAIRDEDLASIPLCTGSYATLYDFANAPLFTFYASSFAPSLDMSMASQKSCPQAYATTEAYGTMAPHHARYGMLGSDQMAICRVHDVSCRVPLQTGFKPYRKGRSKYEMMAELQNTLGLYPSSAANTIGRLNTFDTLDVLPTSSLYSAMATRTPFVLSSYTTVPPTEIKIDLEVSETLFAAAFNTASNAVGAQFTLSAYGTCNDADEQSRLSYLGYRTTPTADSGAAVNSEIRYSKSGARSAKVVRLQGSLPAIPTAFKDALLVHTIPLVVCMRMAGYAAKNAAGFGEWFSLPQFSGVPFQSIIAAADGGATWNNTYLPTIANTAVNRWEIWDRTQELALNQLVARQPTLYTAAYLSVPRTEVPNPRAPIFNNEVRIRIHRSTIDNSPWVYFALDTTLDICNVNLASNFTRSSLSSYNSTHYELSMTKLWPGPSAVPFYFGGANISLCGSVARSGAVWMPVTTHVNFVSRCPFGKAYSTNRRDTPTFYNGAVGGLDANGCFSCSSIGGHPSLCGGAGACGTRAVGLYETTSASCACNDPVRYNASTNCGRRNNPNQLTHTLEIPETKTRNIGLSMTPVVRGMTVTPAVTRTVPLHDAPAGDNSTQLVCYWNTAAYDASPPSSSSSSSRPANVGAPSLQRYVHATSIRYRMAAVGTYASSSSSDSSGSSAADDDDGTTFYVANHFFPSDLLITNTGSYMLWSAVGGLVIGGIFMLQLAFGGVGMLAPSSSLCLLLFGGVSSQFSGGSAADEVARQANIAAEKDKTLQKRKDKLARQLLKEMRRQIADAAAAQQHHQMLMLTMGGGDGRVATPLQITMGSGSRSGSAAATMSVSPTPAENASLHFGADAATAATIHFNSNAHHSLHNTASAAYPAAHHSMHNHTAIYAEEDGSAAMMMMGGGGGGGHYPQQQQQHPLLIRQNLDRLQMEQMHSHQHHQQHGGYPHSQPPPPIMQNAPYGFGEEHFGHTMAAARGGGGGAHYHHHQQQQQQQLAAQRRSVGGNTIHSDFVASPPTSRTHQQFNYDAAAAAHSASAASGGGSPPRCDGGADADSNGADPSNAFLTALAAQTAAAREFDATI